MSDVNSELDEIDGSFSVYSEFESADTVSNVSLSPLRTQDWTEKSPATNIIRNLCLRELGQVWPKKPFTLRSYHLHSLFSHQILSTHVFMGMTHCGRYLITYTVMQDQDDDEWYATIYKYRLHWWTFRPGGTARKIAEVSLFGSRRVIAPLQLYVCQWPKDFEKILVYGLLREPLSVDVSVSSHQHAFVTISALPSLDNCTECKVVASSYLLDDIAASWDTCLRFSCLQHGYTVHTSFDIVVPYPEFVPKVNLKCQDYAVFNTNNFLYAIKIDLENCGEKRETDNCEGCDFVSETLFSEGDVSRSYQDTRVEGMEDVEDECKAEVQLTVELTDSQLRAMKVKEQIIRDFSEELHAKRDEHVEVDESSQEEPMSPPMPTRIADFDKPDNDRCFRSPQSGPVRAKAKVSCDRKVKDGGEPSRRTIKSFFTRQKNYLVKKYIVSDKNLFKQPKPVADSNICSLLTQTRFIESQVDDYEFVDDSQLEVEKISQFRKKRLADKKYEFQEFDSENIIPFSIMRLRSPRKSIEARIEEGPPGPEEGPSPKNLTVSINSPNSPLILEILSSPTQVECVLRPFNRNTTNPLSPLTHFLNSPPLCQRVSRSPNPLRSSRAHLELKHRHSQLNTQAILEKGILIHDISDKYLTHGLDETYEMSERDIYMNLFDNIHRFHGVSIRFQRRFIDVDDELVSVLTDIEDDDMSTVTGYHTALNLEVHGAGYSQLQMISNWKAEKINAPCVVVDQQSLDIEGICHSVATTLCNVANKTYTFCNDYDIEILDVCPRSSEVFVLLMMRIEGSDGAKESSQPSHYEASVTFYWSLQSGHYRICMVVPPQRVNWVWNEKDAWNPAKEAAKRFRLQLPADVTMCEPGVRVLTSTSAFRGVSLSHIEDVQNGVRFIL